MLLTEKQQFSEILTRLSDALDITENQYETAEKRYKSLGMNLQEEGSSLALFYPEVYPQGSFRLGTVIRPLNREEEFDLDLVCNLKVPPADITQYKLKQMIGNRLKGKAYYEQILEPEGNRCWTLKYTEEPGFHMDILPAIPDQYTYMLEKVVEKDVLQYAIRITDKRHYYYNSSDTSKWLKSNPIGYAEWFKEQMITRFREERILIAESLKMSEEDISDWRVKTPLQRAVQIMKRHRDIMFGDDDDKPISIIITTLAAKAYNQEDNIYDALMNLLNKMPHQIEYIINNDSREAWIPNPVNPYENFADKWVDHPQRERNFYKWLYKVKQDIELSTRQKGLHKIKESMEENFGRREITEAFNKIGQNLKYQRESGNLRMAAGTGMLGETGRTEVKNHNFFGVNE